MDFCDFHGVIFRKPKGLQLFFNLLKVEMEIETQPNLLHIKRLGLFRFSECCAMKMKNMLFYWSKIWVQCQNVCWFNRNLDFSVKFLMHQQIYCIYNKSIQTSQPIIQEFGLQHRIWVNLFVYFQFDVLWFL